VGAEKSDAKEAKTKCNRSYRTIKRHGENLEKKEYKIRGGSTTCSC
jgi:hypothetical protein